MTPTAEVFQAALSTLRANYPTHDFKTPMTEHELVERRFFHYSGERLGGAGFLAACAACGDLFSVTMFGAQPGGSYATSGFGACPCSGRATPAQLEESRIRAEHGGMLQTILAARALPGAPDNLDYTHKDEPLLGAIRAMQTRLEEAEAEPAEADLGWLIIELARFPQDLPVFYDFTETDADAVVQRMVPVSVRSYRGNYRDAALDAKSCSDPRPAWAHTARSLGKLLADAATGEAVYSGYKGGDFRFSLSTTLHIANWGEAADRVFRDVVQVNGEIIIRTLWKRRG